MNLERIVIAILFVGMVASLWLHFDGNSNDLSETGKSEEMTALSGQVAQNTESINKIVEFLNQAVQAQQQQQQPQESQEPQQ